MAKTVWSFVAAHADVIKTIAEIVAGFVAAKVAFSALSPVISILTGGWKILSAAIGIGTTIVQAFSGALMFLFANPIGLCIVALAALAAAVYGVLRYFGMSGPIDDFADNIIKSVKKATGSVLGYKDDLEKTGKIPPPTGIPGETDSNISFTTKIKAAQDRINKLKEQQQQERDSRLRPVGPMKVPALAPGKEHPEKEHPLKAAKAAKPDKMAKEDFKIEFVGLSQLAEKMQQEAARQAEREEELNIQREQSGHLAKLSGTIEGGALQVNVTNFPNAPSQWGNQ
jgi:hypothetical protein